MEYLLVMALSGSTMAVVYLVLRRLLWHKTGAGTFYLLAKVAILYYLIPLPFLKTSYKDVMRVFVPKVGMKVKQMPLTVTNFALHTQERLYVNIYAELQLAVVVIWLFGSCFQIGRRLVEYVRMERLVARYAKREMTDRHREVVTDLKARYGVRRPVTLYLEEDGAKTMTFGVFKPVILCSKEPGSHEAELLLRHEMVHIRRWDVFWQILLQFATFLHWWNPLLWKLSRDFERDCECSCDETAMSGRSEAEVKEYLLLLVAEATAHNGTKRVAPQWKASFGDDAEKIKERMENLMKRKKWNRFAAVALVAALTFANSMTVFAYRDTVHMEVEEVPQEEVERTLNAGDVKFAFDETTEEMTQELELPKVSEIRYDSQFTDEDGNIYPVEDEGVEPHHTHNMKSGTLTDHTKNSSGGCEVREFKAQMCTTCSYIIRGDLVAIYTYVVCPH